MMQRKKLYLAFACFIAGWGQTPATATVSCSIPGLYASTLHLPSGNREANLPTGEAQSLTTYQLPPEYYQLKTSDKPNDANNHNTGKVIGINGFSVEIFFILCALAFCYGLVYRKLQTRKEKIESQ